MTSSILSETRQAFRSLRSSRAFTSVVILTLGVAIGLALTVFSIVHSLLWRPLSYGDERLVLVWEYDLGQSQRVGMASTQAFDYWRGRTGALETLALVQNTAKSLTASDIPETPLGRLVSEGYFPILGVQPILGRLFQAEDMSLIAPRVVILSHSLWQRQFGGRQSILGQGILLDEERYEVIGVLPADYRSPIQDDPPQFWLPLRLASSDLNAVRRSLVYGRLAPGSTLEQARQEMAGLSGDLHRLHPSQFEGRAVQVGQVCEVLVASVRPTLVLLLGAAALVLVIAFSNTANLALARLLGRGGDMALRLSLGAHPGVLLRQLVIEHNLLAAAASLLGLGIAHWGIQWVVGAVPMDWDPALPRFDNAHVDASTSGAALALALAMGTGLGLASYPRMRRQEIASLLRSGAARSSVNPGRRKMRMILMSLEVALALTLLIGAGLLVQNALNRQSLDLGFEKSRILTMRTGLRGADYQDPARRVEFFRTALAEIRALPGVESVGASSRIPPSTPLGMAPLRVHGLPAAPTGSEPQALERIVTPGLFKALSIPLRKGRLFDDRDAASTRAAAVVNEALAHCCLAGLDPIGTVIELGGSAPEEARIVGVVGDVRMRTDPPSSVPIVYRPHAQKATATMSFAVRTQGDDPLALAPSVRRVIGNLDRLMPTFDVSAMNGRIRKLEWRSEFAGLLSSVFASFASFLALGSISSAVAFGVNERMEEFGIRIALGAKQRHIILTALKQGITAILWGVAGGLAAAVALSSVVESQLFGVNSLSPPIYLGFVALVIGAGLAATGLPAIRALRADAAATLRQLG